MLDKFRPRPIVERAITMRPARQRHFRAGVWPSGWLMLACLATAGCTNLGPSEHPVFGTAPPLKAGVYTLETVDVRPSIIKEVPAVFPSDLYGYLTAKATVSFTVGVDGKAADAVVTEADSGEFGDAAVRALSKWQFLPAQVKSKPVPCRMSLQFFFDSPYGADTDIYTAGAPSSKDPYGGPPATAIVPQ